MTDLDPELRNPSPRRRPLVVIRRNPDSKWWHVYNPTLGQLYHCAQWPIAIRFACAWLCRMDREGNEAKAAVEASMNGVRKCVLCDGDGVVDDPSACGDPDHCPPMVWCNTCEGEGEGTVCGPPNVGIA